MFGNPDETLALVFELLLKDFTVEPLPADTFMIDTSNNQEPTQFYPYNTEAALTVAGTHVCLSNTKDRETLPFQRLKDKQCSRFTLQDYTLEGRRTPEDEQHRRTQ